MAFDIGEVGPLQRRLAAQVVQRAAVGHLHEEPAGVLHRDALGHLLVQRVPGLVVERLQIGVGHGDAAAAQLGRHRPQGRGLQRLVIALQLTLSPKASRADPRGHVCCTPSWDIVVSKYARA